MGIVDHVPNDKNYKVKEVHRLSRFNVRFENSLIGVSMVHGNSKSYLVVEVKTKQHLDHLLIEKKNKFVLSLMSHSPKGWMRYLGTNIYFVYQTWITYKKNLGKRSWLPIFNSCGCHKNVS